MPGQNKSLMLVGGILLIAGAGYLVYDLYRKSRFTNILGPPFTYNGKTYQVELHNQSVTYSKVQAGRPAPAASADWEGVGNDIQNLSQQQITGYGKSLSMTAGNSLQLELTVGLRGSGGIVPITEAPIGVAGWLVYGLQTGQRPIYFEGHFFENTNISDAGQLPTNAVYKVTTDAPTVNTPNVKMNTYALSANVFTPLDVVLEIAPRLAGGANENLHQFVQETGAIWVGQTGVIKSIS